MATTIKGEDLDVFYFVSRSSSAANDWIRAYFSTIPHDRATQAIRLMQQSHLERGMEALRSFQEEITRLEEQAEEQATLAKRWYYSVLAYHQYRLEQFEQSLRSLDLAQRCVEKSVDRRRFLLPFLWACEEFSIQRARIARARRQWKEMRFHIKQAEDFTQSLAPLCTFSDGQIATSDTIRLFYEAIPQLSAEERESTSFRYVADVKLRTRELRSIVQHIYTIPGFVIPYGLPESNGR